MAKLNKKQREYLATRRSKMVELRKMVIEKYTPAMFANITQIRTTIMSLSITSGAIAAFSINLFSNEQVRNKLLLLIAFLLLLLVVWEGYLYLKSILEKENNQLAKTTDDFHGAITKVRNAIDNVSRTGSPESVIALQKAEENINKVFGDKSSKTESWFMKNIGDLMLIPFSLALLLIAFSFFDFSPLLILCKSAGVR